MMYELQVPCFHLEVEQDTIMDLEKKRKTINVHVVSLDPNPRHAL